MTSPVYRDRAERELTADAERIAVMSTFAEVLKILTERVHPMRMRGTVVSITAHIEPDVASLAVAWSNSVVTATWCTKRLGMVQVFASRLLVSPRLPAQAPDIALDGDNVSACAERVARAMTDRMDIDGPQRTT